MKKLTLLLCAAFATLSMQAQIKTPAPSPASTLTQVVGLSEVTIDYSRPSMKGRTIFGDLVPYDKVWRTGANGRTKVTFSEAITIDGKAVKAGTYALFAKPSKTTWDLFLYTDYNGGGAPATWEDDKVAVKTTVEPIRMPMDVETFTITVDDLTNDAAVIGLLWEDVYVPLKFTVATDAAVVKNIDQVMAGPSSNDYYAAAVYYLNSGKDISKAKTWIDKAISMNDKPAFWQLRQQSLIYAKSGDKKGAIDVAKKSLAAAKEAGNDDYVKMNEDSLKEWGSK